MRAVPHGLADGWPRQGVPRAASVLGPILVPMRDAVLLCATQVLADPAFPAQPGTLSPDGKQDFVRQLAQIPDVWDGETGRPDYAVTRQLQKLLESFAVVCRKEKKGAVVFSPFYDG